ncbi:hypothetical protein HAHE_17070 [Haloferula helveola]|uniref:Uncharacterized protein n=1 Tax=Haloferula helveola TaxID=490095 RepID=A0ABM7RBL2_9BACT|nr:hypothetical protein HAHE_17070 [Haloferula helveola]
MLGGFLVLLALVLGWRLREGSADSAGEDPIYLNSSSREADGESSDAVTGGKLAVREERRPRSLLDRTDLWTADGADPAAPGGGGWKFEDGKLVSSGSGAICRRVEMPRFAKLSFNLGQAENLRFQIRVLADGVGKDAKNHIELTVRNRYLYVRERWSTERAAGSRTLGTGGAVDLGGEDGSTMIDLFISREDRAMVVFVDGKRKLVAWNADSMSDTVGDWLELICSASSDLAVSDMTLSEWKGPLPDGSDLLAAFGQTRERYSAMAAAASEWKGLRTYRIAGDRLAVHEGRRSSSSFEKPLDDETVSHYRDVILQVPLAKPVPENPDMVINPYTGEQVNIRGFPRDAVLRDPEDPDPEHVFRLGAPY